ncbi:MAG: hypothetical protein WBO69_01310 [Thermoanaerobaculia bacterium]|jgi:hypothetical protein
MKRRMPISTLAMGLILLVCGVSPGDAYLLENFEFPNDLSGWTPGSGAWSHEPSQGFLGLGAAKVASVVGANSLSQCAELKGLATGDGLRFLAFARAENHTNPVQVSLEVFTTTDCTGGAVETYHRQVDSPTMASWTQINVVNSLPAGSVFSVRAWVTAHATSAGEITLFDFVSVTDNLAPNPDFTDNLDGWEAGPYSWSHEPADGLGTPLGSAEVVVDIPDCGAGNSCAFLSKCVNLDTAPRTPFYFGSGEFKALDVAETYVAAFLLYPEAGCGGTLITQAAADANVQQVGVWERFSTSFAVPKEVKSVGIFVGTNDSTLGSRFRVDNVFLVPSARNEVFFDGFESGVTSAWSSTVP